MRPADHCDVIVLGAGAAGLMCAIESGKGGKRVALLERSERIGKKILISGGGRCNFTNIGCSPDNFLSSNPHFCKSALSRYTPADFIALVEKHGIAYHEKTLGQLFCDGSSSEIVEMLAAECRAAGVQTIVNVQVEKIAKNGEFAVHAKNGEFRAPCLVIASGGLSIPKMGATNCGHQWARQFGLMVKECRPGLVPLTLSTDDCRRYCDLAGVSLEVNASCASAGFREKMLITHRGLSGPAILQASSFWSRQSAVELDLAPGREVTRDAHSQPDKRAENVRATLRQVWPSRFADRWLDLNSPKQWNNTGLAELEQRIHHWQVFPVGTEGYAKAEVTVGGVDTDELSSRTMECKKVPRLFFIGEVVDVTGHLGGFNFQWAWSSGAAAGRYLAERR